MNHVLRDGIAGIEVSKNGIPKIGAISDSLKECFVFLQYVVRLKPSVLWTGFYFAAQIQQTQSIQQNETAVEIAQISVMLPMHQFHHYPDAFPDYRG